MNLKTKFKKHLRAVMSLKTSPHSIALGFSVGTFISIVPTPGMNILIGTLLVLVFKKLNKFSLLGSMAIWNPITMIPIYYLSVKIGSLIFGSAPVVKYHIEFLNQAYDYSRRFLAGNIIIALTVSFACYYLVRYIVIWHRARTKPSS